MLYAMWLLVGAIAMGMLFRAIHREQRFKRAQTERYLGTWLRAVQPGRAPEYATLWAGYFTIGRRKRKVDLALREDPRISRIHCVLWLSPEGRWMIRPVYHGMTLLGRLRGKAQADYYSNVLVNGQTVPAAGTELWRYDEIKIGESKLRLEEIGEEEMMG